MHGFSLKIIFWLSAISITLWIKVNPYNILFWAFENSIRVSAMIYRKMKFRIPTGFSLSVSLISSCPWVFYIFHDLFCPLAKNIFLLKLAWSGFCFLRTKIFQSCILWSIQHYWFTFVPYSWFLFLPCLVHSFPWISFSL